MNDRAQVLMVDDLRTTLETPNAMVRAVDGVSFELRAGETFALVGESGCGKSMTALSLMRLLPEVGLVTGGSVRLDGVDLLDLPEAAMRAVRGRRVAMIFQEPATSLNPVLTVGRQIVEVLERHIGLSGEVARAKAIALLEAVGIAESARRFDEFPFQLSGGLKQRVMIACALAADPEVLVADEPTTALDVTIQAQILDLLSKLQAERGMAMLLITHDLGIVSRMAHRVAVMYAGEIVEVADRASFFRSPQHPYSQRLFAALPSASRRAGPLEVIAGQVPALSGEFHSCRFAQRCTLAFERCHREIPPLVRVTEVHEARCFLREQGPAPARMLTHTAVPSTGDSANNLPDAAEPLLQVRDLEVHFPIRKGLFRRTVGQVKAVDGISFSIAEGRTLALVGESGCGKTTAGKALLQLVPPTRGSVLYRGEELAGLSRAAMRRHRAEMQIIFQDPYASLNPRMRIADILVEGMRALGAGVRGETEQARIDQLLSQVGLPAESRARYPHEFSGGQRQRIAIARALAVEPRLIVCDEPTSALDVSVQAQILNLLEDLQQRLGIAYLFITHNMAVVRHLAHDVAVMRGGRIVEQGPAEAVLDHPQHEYTRTLLAAVPRLEM